MISLTDRKWKKFEFSEIFAIHGGFYNKKPEASGKGKIPFLGAVDNNNGVTEWYTIDEIKNNSKTGKNANEPLDKKIFPKNAICVTNNGSVGHAYYQPYKFTCSHDVNPLYLKKHDLNKYIAYFLIVCIEKQSVCFQYIHKWRPKRMKKSSIMLPVNKKGKPDYQFMEDYMKEKEEKIRISQIQRIQNRLNKLGNYVELKSLSDLKWKSFKLSDVFDEIERGKRLKNEDHVKGDKPYVSSSGLDNGVADWIGNKNKIRKFSNCLSLANSGSVGSCFYEPFEFVASDHITHLKNNNFDEYIYIFCSSMLSRLKDKYNFNREINDFRISRETILLPIDEEEKIEYAYIQQYVKNLFIKKCEDIKKYLSF